MHFCAANRNQVKESRPGIAGKEMFALLAQMWNELTEEQRGEWNKLYADEKKKI